MHMAESYQVLVGTRIGAWVISAGNTRSRWSIRGPEQLGSAVYHFIADPRNPEHWLMAVARRHLGPTVLRSSNQGKTWTEASQPPAFAPAGAEGGSRSVDHVFWLTPGHVSQPGVWYAGTSPQGLFKSLDGGDTWQEVRGLNNHPDFFLWRSGDKDGTPNGPRLHSIIVDQTNPAHLLIGMSSGGIFESWDEGTSWAPLNKGVAIDFYPPRADGSEYDYGHDPHCVVMHPLENTRLYHQNHCGIYRLDRHRTDRWERIGNNMPKDVGDIGFPMVVHPQEVDTAWVFPMDGSGLWPRTSPGGRPAVYRTRDGGSSWERQDQGFPEKQAWWTVLRQAMATDQGRPVGLYLGATNGQVWASFDEGGNWRSIARDLPQIYSIEVLTVP
ncbi:MAG: hypothetical protein RLZZ385_1220 [Pseudomonadota bacterium]|jgi:photosystem II stability/assembly factor-like uncharacterized protein